MTLRCEVVCHRGDFRLEVAFDSPARSVGVGGVSGAGKTTLLHALAGLVPVQRAFLAVEGAVVIDTDRGVAPPPHARGVGYVFQDTRLFPHLGVAGNIAYGRRFARRPVEVERLIQVLGLGTLLHRRTRDLSGGEARRVAIARALAAGPRLLLLDEPFSGLDQARRAELIPYLTALAAEIEVAMLVVSHHQADLDALTSDRIALDAGRISPARRP